MEPRRALHSLMTGQISNSSRSALGRVRVLEDERRLKAAGLRLLVRLSSLYHTLGVTGDPQKAR